MQVEFVVAMSENRVIGKGGQLPWHLPKDLRHFKQLTVGKNVLMGRKTFSAIGKPLPNRRNLVLTRDKNFLAAGAEVYHSKSEVEKIELDGIMVIGGQEIFQLFLPDCRRIHLTMVHAVLDGDAFFPPFTGFVEESRAYHTADAHHAFGFSFIEYVRAPVSCGRMWDKT